MYKLTPHQEFVQEYLDYLEESGVDYLGDDDMGEGYHRTYIREEFAEKSDLEMAVALGFGSYEDWERREIMSLEEPAIMIC